jgi:hypothetical protein
LLKLNWPIDYLKNAQKIAENYKNDYLIKQMKKVVAEHKIKNRKKKTCCFG